MKGFQILIATLLTTSAALYSSTLPVNFYRLIIDNQTNIIKTSDKFDNNQTIQALYILIPDFIDSAPSTDSTLLIHMQAFIQNGLTIPTDLINKNLQATPLYFDWQDKIGMNTLKEPAQSLARGLDALLASINCPCIVVTLGRAGLLLNNASQNMKNKISVTIQLGTPIPKTIEHQYADFLPNTNIISNLYQFYSTTAFTFDNATLHPLYQTTLPTITNFSPYNILLLINNQQPNQVDFLDPEKNALIGKNLLKLCTIVKKNYSIQHNLFAHITNFTGKENTHNLVGIITDDGSSKKETAFSTNQISTFMNTWQRAPALSISKGTTARNLYSLNDTSKKPKKV